MTFGGGDGWWGHRPGFNTPAGDSDMKKIGQARNTLMSIKLSQESKGGSLLYNAWPSIDTHSLLLKALYGL